MRSVLSELTYDHVDHILLSTLSVCSLRLPVYLLVPYFGESVFPEACLHKWASGYRYASVLVTFVHTLRIDALRMYTPLYSVYAGGDQWSGGYRGYDSQIKRPSQIMRPVSYVSWSDRHIRETGQIVRLDNQVKQTGQTVRLNRQVKQTG